MPPGLKPVEHELAERRSGLDAADGKPKAAEKPQTRHDDVLALRVDEEVDVVTGRGERRDHGPHGERRAAHFEEGLRREEQDPQ